MSDSAKLVLGEQEHELSIHKGTEGQRAIDISKLLAQTGHITLDDGYGNTGSTESQVTYVDGDSAESRSRRRTWKGCPDPAAGGWRGRRRRRSLRPAGTARPAC